MGTLKSALILFFSIFVLYAVYMWFIKESRDLPQLLLESFTYSALLTIISTTLDLVRNKFKK